MLPTAHELQHVVQGEEDILRIIGSERALGARGTRHYCRLLLWSVNCAIVIGVIVIVVALLLDAGLWKSSYGELSFNTSEDSHGSIHVATLVAPLGLSWVLSSNGDRQHRYRRSALELRMGAEILSRRMFGRELNGPDEGVYFEHWQDQVWVFDSRGRDMTSLGSVGVTHTWHMRPWLVQVAAMVMFLGLVGRRVAQRGSPSDVAVCLGTGFRHRYLPSILTLSSVALGALSILYLCSVLWAAMEGIAWPSAHVFHLMPSFATWLGQRMTTLPYALLLLVAAVAWGSLGGARHAVMFARLEILWLAVGLPVIGGYLLFFISSMWAGMRHDEAINAASVFASLPFNDASGHLSASFRQAVNGHWGDFAERRPLAAAWRTALMHAVAFSPPRYLLLQTALLSAAMFCAFVSVVRWRGVLSALVFLVLMLVLVTPYVGTVLTEPLAFPLALLAVVPLLAALRSGNIGAGLVGLLLLALALMMRMGSMFVLPAIALWLAMMAGGAGVRRWQVIAVACVAIGLPWVVSGAVASLYGSGATLASNFSHTLCGLAHGGNWTTCPQLYASEMAQVGGLESAEAVAFMYSQALHAIANEPTTLALRLLEGAASFLLYLPVVLFSGFGQSPPKYFPIVVIVALVLHALTTGRWRSGGAREGVFWMLIGLGVTMSASVVYFDDGWRVLSVALPLIALFVATCVPGASSCSSAMQQTGFRPCLAGIVPGAVGLSVLLLCLLAPALPPPSSMQGDAAEGADKVLDEGGRDLLGGPYMAAVLVVPDEQVTAPRGGVVSWSALQHTLDLAGLEPYRKLPLEARPDVPFGLVAAFQPGGHLAHYVVPSEMVTSPEVRRWRVTLREAGSGDIWRRVVQARALSSR